jgi:hypothetical protein
MPTAVLYREVLQGYTGPLKVNCGDNAAVSSDGAVERRYLNGGESVSSATAACTSYPTGAVIGAGQDLEVTTPVTVGSTTVEIAGEIATTGEWFSIAVVVKDTAILGQYDITGKITTSAGRVIKYCIHAIIKTC